MKLPDFAGFQGTGATITALHWTAPGPNPAAKHALHIAMVFGPHLLKVVYLGYGADIPAARATSIGEPNYDAKHLHPSG